jgi:hypothetical protein
MTEFSLGSGIYIINGRLTGYDTLNATISIDSFGEIECINVTNGLCGGSSVPRVEVSGNTVIIYLKQTAVTPPTDNYNTWLESKGGKPGMLSNLPALLEICDAYLGFIGVGYTVTLSNLLTTCDYYLGFG